MLATLTSSCSNHAAILTVIENHLTQPVVDEAHFLYTTFTLLSWKTRRLKGQKLEQNPEWLLFSKRVEVGAFVDAALMLIPIGYRKSITDYTDGGVHVKLRHCRDALLDVSADANKTSVAICLAALRAHIKLTL